MTLVNTETGELVESLTVEDARRLTDRIRLLGENLADTLDKMAELIDQARTGSAWLALGYRSWTEYVATEFASVLPRLGREPRQEFVRALDSRGMSTRAIAPIVGADHSTVVRDLARGASAPPQAPEVEAEPVDMPPTVEPTRTRPPVVGIDGKTYLRSVPVDHAARADLAIEKYPDLAYYRDEVCDLEHCWRLADKLDEFDSEERDERIQTLRRSIDLDRRKRNGTYVPARPIAASCPTCGQTLKDRS